MALSLPQLIATASPGRSSIRSIPPLFERDILAPEVIPMTVTLEPAHTPLRVDETGTIRVGQTRVTFDVFIGAYRHGTPPEALAEQFESLDLADIYGAISYYLRHREDLDRYLVRREAEADQLRKEIEEMQGPRLTRQILLDRLAAKNATPLAT